MPWSWRRRRFYKGICAAFLVVSVSVGIQIRMFLGLADPSLSHKGVERTEIMLAKLYIKF
jgi:hypothetical protein